MPRAARGGRRGALSEVALGRCRAPRAGVVDGQLAAALARLESTARPGGCLAGTTCSSSVQCVPYQVSPQRSHTTQFDGVASVYFL